MTHFHDLGAWGGEFGTKIMRISVCSVTKFARLQNLLLVENDAIILFLDILHQLLLLYYVTYTPLHYNSAFFHEKFIFLGK
jgi:hypothetical protein